ncbi:WecB/TagA/CpsF family glycosyltransferase [Klebsiella pneumoniae]|uniref:WecB/TagA/CpsF family glycosyltransferase n=1 Tax=Klebsiella pneumoniae TaxID=573 RepID=UPI002265A91B|nr:WecB/TagA/CpsF family glycosyltransferase [Klebsiella pneumoniae]
MLLVKTRHGYFKDEKERSQFVQELVELEPDIVIVGMGTPAQDIFLNDMFLTKWSGVAFTCGGFYTKQQRMVALIILNFLTNII